MRNRQLTFNPRVTFRFGDSARIGLMSPKIWSLSRQVEVATGASRRPPGVRCRMKRISAFCRPPSALLLALLFFPGCNALNPFCGGARAAPIIGSLSATTITFADVQQGFLLTVNGSQFVSSSVVVINGTQLSTTVMSSQQLQVTITTALISAPGTASVTVNTPSGNSGDLACTSGGTSSALILTIT
jgi:hypothetical protein